MADFKVQFTDGDAFAVKFTGRDTPNFKAKMGEIQVVSVGAPPYEGDYIVTPKTEAQTLETKNKRMEENVTVKSIPYYEADNKKGTTIYIGSEV